MSTITPPRIKQLEKTFPAVRLKLDDSTDLAEGEFVAYPAVFDVVDSHQDKIIKGAFADSLREWKESGNVIPVLWGHDFGNPLHNIGGVIDAEEDDKGLKVHGKFDLDSETGRHVHRLVKEKRVADLSFAFNVIEEKHIKDEDTGEHHWELLKLKLYEVSVVPIGANRETEFTAVKSEGSRAVKAHLGRAEKAQSNIEAAKHLMAAAEKCAEMLQASFTHLANELKASLSTEGEGKKNHADTAHTQPVDVASEEPAGVKEQDGTESDVSADVMEQQIKFYALRAESEESS